MTKTRTILAGIILNLILFIVVTSLPAFQELHHHWIFPVLGVIISAQWALATIPRLGSVLDLKAARTVSLFMLGFLILMGVVRHQTILACFGRCMFKLGSASALAAAVYLGQARLGDDSFWNPARAYTAALACALWAVFLILFGLRLPAWELDSIFVGIAAISLIWRRFPAVKVTACAIAPILLIRRYFGENAIIVLNLLIACAGVYMAGGLDAPARQAADFARGSGKR